MEGYDDPHDLVRDIVSSGLAEKLARYSPMGFTGPMALGGYYFPGAIKKTEDGLDFGEEFKNYLKVLKDKYIGIIMVMAQYHANLGLEYLGTMCPVADEGGGIHQLAEVFAACIAKLPELRTN